MRKDDLVARLGGDEFAVITAGAYHTSLQALATRSIATLCAPYSIGNHSIVIGASIGIAVIHEHVGGSADVMRHADMALYRAKNEGRNRACIYDEAMDANLLRRKLLERDLRSAIENDDRGWRISRSSTTAGTVLGVEALCRWNHPQHGAIAPVEFIPVAENSGLIVPLGELVLRRACLDANAGPAFRRGQRFAAAVPPHRLRRRRGADPGRNRPRSISARA